MKLGRREFVKLIPLAVVAIVTGSWWFSKRTSQESPETTQTTSTTTITSASKLSTSTTPQLTSTTSELTTVTSTIPTVTSTAEAFSFPVTWNGDEPTTINPKDYRLTIDGDVPRSMQFTLEDLQSMSSLQRTLKIQCVTGWAADVSWDGIPLLFLLRESGVSPENIAKVTIKSITGYEITLNLDEITNSDTMIALKAGGFPLTVEHGYPARLVVPTRLGVDWVKYVTRITCTNS